MMDAVNDDTNVDDSFEFLEGRMDEKSSKGESVSISTQSSVKEDVRSLPSTTHVLSSVPPAINSLFTMAPTSSSGLFSPADPSKMSSQFLPTASPAAPAVPMYNPNAKNMASPMSFAPPPALASPQIYQPVQSTNPYISPGPGYVPHPSGPPADHVNSSTVGIPQAAYELPLDNYGSSSNQPFSESSDRGVWGWIRGSEFLNKVAEKAKNSVDSVITTLDPGMKEIIYSGGDVNLIVASNNETKVSAVREAFQQTFGKATVGSAAVQATSIAPQPVGFSAGTKAAEERISNLRQQGLISENQVVVAVENFLAELTPDKWFDIGCLLLQDPRSGISLQVYTQATPVASHFVMQAKEQTPADFPLGWSGFAVTIGQVLGPALGVHHSEWHQALTSISRRDMLLLAAKSLAGMYKAQWKNL